MGIDKDNLLIIGGLIAACFIIVIIILILLSKKLNKYIDRNEKLQKIINSQPVEDLLIGNIEQMRKVENNYKTIIKNIEKIKLKLGGTIQNIGMVRYSATAEIGGEISYSASFIDDYNNGFVITGIYYRDGMNTFVKHINEGESKIPLTPEEKKSLQKAIEYKTEKNRKFEI